MVGEIYLAKIYFTDLDEVFIDFCAKIGCEKGEI
jgi:hypothetical protein